MLPKSESAHDKGNSLFVENKNGKTIKVYNILLAWILLTKESFTGLIIFTGKRSKHDVIINKNNNNKITKLSSVNFDSIATD